MKQEMESAAKSNHWSYFWLLIGTILLIFANGRWIIPLAAWLAPVFILRFVRTQKPARGLVSSLLALVVAYIVAWRGLIPLPGIFYYIVAGGIALTFWLAFLADRLMTPRLKGFAGTLVFPLVWVMLEYVYTLTNPFLSWGTLAYTQYGNLPLVQIVSITGIWGVSFLVTWFAAVINWAWERDFTWQQIRWGASLCTGVLALVMLLGGLRLAIFISQAETVRIDSVISTPETNGLPNSDVLDNYLERTRRQARAGADIVLWDEGAVYATQEDESLLIDRCCELARQEGIYLLIGLCVSGIVDDRGDAVNKAVWIDSSGAVAFEHRKYFLIPGGSFIAGDGQLRMDDTPYGRITAAICMDLDQPAFIRQAGRAGADILLAPSFDWEEIDPIHTRMASFRAVENGFSLVRATCEGLSAAFDYHGRILSTADFFTTNGESMVSYVPTQGVRTVYSMIGDLFAWLCAVGVAVLIGWLVLARLLRADY
jgi:apolipoprotein N-acyltransferase